MIAKSNVLVVEDDRALSEVLKYNVEQAGCRVRVARDGYDALRQAQDDPPDLVILDLMLPIVDGFEVCRQLRAQPSTAQVLIMMLTAKAQESDQIAGLNLGADDYITKPFSIRLLIERMRALFRRIDSKVSPRDVAQCQGISIDRFRHQASMRDEPLDLTPTEFRLLETLVRHPGRAFSRDELIDSAMGENTVVLERTVDVHIRALRRKLGERADLVETVRGVGYRFQDPVTGLATRGPDAADDGC